MNCFGNAYNVCQSATSLYALPPTYKSHISKTSGGFASFLHPQMIFMSINLIVAIKNTYRTIGCGETHYRRGIKNLKPVNMTNKYKEMNTTPILL